MGLYATAVAGVGASEARGGRGMKRCVREERHGEEIYGPPTSRSYMSCETRGFKVMVMLRRGRPDTRPAPDGRHARKKGWWAHTFDLISSPCRCFSFFRIQFPRDPLHLNLARSSTASTHGTRSSARRRARARAPPNPSVGERARPTPPLLHPSPRELRGQPNLLLPRWRAHAFGAPQLRPSSRRVRGRAPPCSQPVPPRGGA
jgi:hypothetical protein